MHRVPKVLASSAETWYLYSHAHSDSTREAAMNPTTSTPTTAPADEVLVEADAVAEAPAPDALVEQDLLVEDVSIDGMCGVY